MDSQDETPVPGAIVKKYVAFCDVLGFSNAVAYDTAAVVENYSAFVRLCDAPNIISSERVTISIYSDSILLTSDSLKPLLLAVQTLWFMALASDYLIRGGIAYGTYWSEQIGNHQVVVSDALVSAVQLEKTISVPAVVIADHISIEMALWALRIPKGGLMSTPLLHFRDRNIVNPFNHFWFNSARSRVAQMLEKNPQFRIKYEWFLALWGAVNDDQLLIPPSVQANWVAAGVLNFREPNATT